MNAEVERWIFTMIAKSCLFNVAPVVKRPSLPIFRKFAGMRLLLTHPYVLVFMGGGAGSLLRYVAGRYVPVMLTGSPFPTAILLVNVVASFILGAVISWATYHQDETTRLLVGVGFCGGLSTFSSFSYDTVALLQNGRIGAALLNIGLNVVLCLLASMAGLWLGQKL
ncbi:fluoride efflux transporter CrcB [Spirosoma flavus]